MLRYPSEEPCDVLLEVCLHVIPMYEYIMPP